MHATPIQVYASVHNVQDENDVVFSVADHDNADHHLHAVRPRCPDYHLSIRAVTAADANWRHGVIRLRKRGSNWREIKQDGDVSDDPDCHTRHCIYTNVTRR